MCMAMITGSKSLSNVPFSFSIDKKFDSERDILINS